MFSEKSPKSKREVSVPHGLLEKRKDSDYKSVEKKKKSDANAAHI